MHRSDWRKALKWSCIAALVCVSGATTAANGEQTAGDQRAEPLAYAVENELHHDSLVSLDDVQVRAKEGVVTLSGSAASLVAKERAARIAETVKGVREVRNEIRVEPTTAMSAEHLKTTINMALLTNPATEAYDVEITAQPNGEVTLTGQVQSWAERELVVRVAKGVTGVTAVHNELQVDPPARRKDAELIAEIERMLRWDAYIRDEDVDVQVRDAVVTLTGLVPSAAEKTRAMRVAQIAGVRGVNAMGLRVEPDPSSHHAAAANASNTAEDEQRREKANTANESERLDAQRARASSRSDAELSQAIRERLRADPAITTDGIRVYVNNNVAMLRGHVASLKERRLARAIADEVSGVRDVRDRLRIRSDHRSMSDAEIAQRIMAGLAANPVTETHRIGVGVKDGVVTLTGHVDSWFERGAADDVAAGVRGVRDVTNNLDVADENERVAYDPYVDFWSIYDYDWYAPQPPTIWKQDAAIERDIRDELFWSPFVSADDISVSVDKGVATLNGVVSSTAELDAAVENAFEGGAAGVVNRLQVEG